MVPSSTANSSTADIVQPRRIRRHHLLLPPPPTPDSPPTTATVPPAYKSCSEGKCHLILASSSKLRNVAPPELGVQPELRWPAGTSAELASAPVVTIHPTKRKEQKSSHDIANLSIIKETLRIHPPGPLLAWARLAVHDIEVGEHFIPAGTTAMVNMWAIAHDESIWPEAEKFRPERFMVVAVNMMGSDMRLAPFNSRRRMSWESIGVGDHPALAGSTTAEVQMGGSGWRD